MTGSRNQRALLGARGEQIAADYLESAGLTVLARNWRCRYGELDIIADDGRAAVFAEVKTRSGTGFGMPAESVTPVKLARIRRLASLWLSEQPRVWPLLRIDVVSVLLVPGREPEIDHLRGVS